MALNVTTDYAIRILLYLATYAENGKSISGKEIATEMRIPYNYFLKLVPNLKNAGFLISFQGKNGGYALTLDPSEITLYDVIAAMNDDIIISECLHNPAACGRNYTDHCAVHNVFSGIQSELDKRLKSMSLAQIVANQSILEEARDV